MNKSATLVQQQIREIANPQKAKLAQRFFKTGPGQYGEGDLFLGITVPQCRNIAKQSLALPLSELKKLLRSKYHEDRLCAAHILVYQVERAMIDLPKAAKFYLQNRQGINNWDLVDTSTPQVVGRYYYECKKSTALVELSKMARSKNLWDRRIAVLASFYFIRQNEFQLTVKLCELLLQDEEDLMHKACGWMLREAGKREQKVLIQFLQKYSQQMPRTMLRYSIEKLSPSQKKKWMRR